MGHQPRRESATPAEATAGVASAATRVMAPATRRARRNGGRRATMARPPSQACQRADLAYGPEDGGSWTHRPRERRRPRRAPTDAPGDVTARQMRLSAGRPG